MLYRNNCLKIALQKIFKYVQFKMTAAAVEKNYRNIESFWINCLWPSDYCSVNLVFTKS